MILRKNTIKETILSLSGEAIDKSILDQQKNGIYPSKIPFQFQYSGSWEVSHKCSNCGDMCSFGLSFDSSKSQFPKLTYEHSEYLCTKYFDVHLLKGISRVFQNVELISNNLGSFLIFNNLFDPDFPVTSSVKPIFYSCNNCNEQFLGIVKNNYPYPPDKGCPEGLIGRVAIDELVSIQLSHCSTFSDLLDHMSKTR